MTRPDRIILAIARSICAIALTAAIVILLLGGCASSQLLAIQCPESARTYCPTAPHRLDSARVAR